MVGICYKTNFMGGHSGFARVLFKLGQVAIRNVNGLFVSCSGLRDGRFGERDGHWTR